jgi:hypothetical protein
MRPSNFVLAFSFLLGSLHARANSEQAPNELQTEISIEAIENSLAVLQSAGLIEIKNGEITVRQTPSVLELLKKNGRLQIESTKAGVICL